MSIGVKVGVAIRPNAIPEAVLNLEKHCSKNIRVAGSWTDRRITDPAGDVLLSGGYRFRVDWNGKTCEKPEKVDTCGAGTHETTMNASFDGLQAEINYCSGKFWVDEQVVLKSDSDPLTITNLQIGLEIPCAQLAGFSASPIPFRVGLDGKSKVVALNAQAESGGFAEGWVVDDGSRGMLVMRLPTGSSHTCFVPFRVSCEGGENTCQIGSIGPDGKDHFQRSPFLDREWQGGEVRLPVTRFVFFQGDWKTGCEIFNHIVSASISRRDARPACPVTYNTFHDFGPSYDRDKLCAIMPQLSSMGIGMLHLDPGWETVWGSNVWNDAAMGDPRHFVKTAAEHGLQVGCWTSVHTQDPEVHGDCYTLNKKSEKYLAEDFTRFNPASVKLWGVCPGSDWKEKALQDLTRLGRAGVRFLNSDFHDWPWSGEGCTSTNHHHEKALSRTDWAEALSDFYASLHESCPEMVIEMHDHVESGEYRTPVWYMYDRPNSYDEKWAYEFMWTTYQDLLDRKLFALYHLRLAEPLPLYLHINMESDNNNALAFWYVASCVTHIGIGAVLRSSENQRTAYARAIGEYNKRFEAFTTGEFHGIDELAHVHVHPSKRSAVVLLFNLENNEVERNVFLDTEAWGMADGAWRASRDGDNLSVSDSSVTTRIGPLECAIVDVEIE